MNVRIQGSSYTCHDGRVEFISRNRDVVRVTSVGPSGAITTIAPGTAVVVTHMTVDNRARDSVVIVVLPEVEMIILQGSEQTDTTQGFLRDSLIVQVREKATGRSVSGIRIFTKSGGTTLSPDSRHTNATGMAAFQLRASPMTVLREPIILTAVCSCTYALDVDTAYATALPGQPHALSISRRGTDSPPTIVMVIGQDTTVDAYAFDRKANLIGKVDATFAVTSGNAVTIAPGGQIVAREVGDATFSARTSYARTGGRVRVVRAQ